jgi:hypothetical protein
MTRAGDGLRADYFANEDWEAPATFSTADTEFSANRLRHRWNKKPPNRFSVRWTGFLTVGTAGDYYFATTSDDGTRLYIDRQKVVDNGGAHRITTRTGKVQLTPGAHLVVLEYSQSGGRYALEWTWSHDGTHYSRVPGWALSRRQTHYATAISARILDGAIRAAAIGVLVGTFVCMYRVRLQNRVALLQWADTRRKSVRLFYGALMVLALWLSLGPPYGLWRHVYWWPGFSFIRANSRFSLVALVGLAVLAGHGFDRLAGAFSEGRRSLLAAIIGVLLVAEFAAMPLAVERSNFDIPPVDEWLNTREKPFVLAEVPVDSEWDQTAYMVHSTAHWQKTVNGYSGWRTVRHTELFARLRRFPDETSLESLSRLGVVYIVVHLDRFPRDQRGEVEKSLAQYSHRLQPQRVEKDAVVYRLVPSAREPPALRP